MVKSLRNLHGLVYALLLFFCLAEGAISQDLSDAKAICGDLTDEKRAMAKAAGYNVEQLCRSLKASDKAQKSPTQIVVTSQPRQTVSSAKKVAAADVVAPVAASGTKAVTATATLRPFGYDLFANVPSTFAPAVNVPVSADYLLGPGDTLDILFYGKINDAFSVEINRDGLVEFPELGPVGLAGLTFAEAKAMLQSLINAQIIGTKASISMGALRSMQIFVLGEAFKPGAYTVSSLATMTHALMSSGGVSDIASLRNIQLKRAGKVVATLDLYELLMSGNTTNDVRLQSADVIYIPTVGQLVSIDGQVLRPAIYELNGETSAEQLIALAGGLGPKAYAQSSRIERIKGDGFMTVIDVDLTKQQDKTLKIQAGDHLRVDAITNYRKNIVTLTGHINHPGDVAWRPGMRVSDVIVHSDQFPPDVDLNYALLIREIAGGANIEVLDLDLAAVLQEAATEADMALQSRDKIIIFSSYKARTQALDTVVKQLQRQTQTGALAKIVTVGGTVRFPGTYPWVEAMRLSDLVEAAGGYTEAAYLNRAEISRLDLSDQEQAQVIIIAANPLVAQTRLQPLDSVAIRVIPEYQETESMVLSGEVKFPGEYLFERGETLSSVIQRAGGFTDIAHIQAAIFTRKTLKLREQQEIDRLKQMLEEQLSADQLIEINSGEEVAAEQQAVQRRAIAELNSVVASGRLVIPLQAIIDRRAEDIILERGDRLMVPKYRQEITVMGEVQRPTSYLFDQTFSLEDYLQQSGGLLNSADKRGIYIVRASGQVAISKRSLWFRRRHTEIEPGDTIVVPLDTDKARIKGVPLLAEVSKIVYQLALGAAALNTLSNSP